MSGPSPCTTASTRHRCSSRCLCVLVLLLMLVQMLLALVLLLPQTKITRVHTPRSEHHVLDTNSPTSSTRSLSKCHQMGAVARASHAERGSVGASRGGRAQGSAAQRRATTPSVLRCDQQPEITQANPSSSPTSPAPVPWVVSPRSSWESQPF
jgi:hypothetical protein